MKILIAVRGVANRGKSASIKKAYQLLKSKYSGANFEEIIFKADIKIIITVKGVKVGIESQGDPSSRLFESLKYFVEVGCQVIICATRTRGETFDAVNALAGQYQIKWIDKPNEPNPEQQEAANDTVAHEIYEEVLPLIPI
ncbi:MAG: hypothetical protein A2268_03005 [Candidatus Raymondbacteria bacterium RifOxyA12_full_50_37]|uniref:Uncharacterized protein n=1 Tax=Candidatus Raymondbacteria bacterium RIFOXYD12_FULL_49_13 TaxID=1817890 RepID=A0A1F7F948_UNCRA|nr:MAG: hypothetical protein A2248_17110 [Candidatus Raymondbacteria bacterium RIFOXYA2_FULL_49_16]OGJ90746.1 MAG: hypothetical protein A2268_03005 [Candidatus Raymondbacteria bacterium RifOxyA12_full_50_37]OGJ98383.1 MAG: hypothetical protein A2453_09015 [Candidatus Raymondbacteria bacterium RIFOXYC2_FULL_50_21]OGK03108.1 MAG: hypothetical protein A2519_06845 [Candidatus Raymondbacteria bacterium RIFOXYD12_FULL_49_13]OGK06607.1 MAG: hypothetical protein A2487_03035 [Candidatus Raymondbacteria 